MNLCLEFIGAGGAHSEDLGNACALLRSELDPILLIDFGSEAFFAAKKRLPEIPAIFITHCHLDHIGGLERLFFDRAFTDCSPVKLYIPAQLIPRIQEILANAGTQVAEGGMNFWDAFHLIPVGRHFYHQGMRFEVFPVRHHFPDEAFGLALPGKFVFTGDTRPIPEQLVKYAARGEVIFHDASITSNPSHSGIEDLERDYKHHNLLDRLVLYHFNSDEQRREASNAGWHTATPGSSFVLDRALDNLKSQSLSLTVPNESITSEPAI